MELDNKFKQSFKYYKRKEPPPSLECVLDPHNPSHQHHHFIEVSPQRCDQEFPPHTRPVQEWRVFACKERPGMKVITGVLSPTDQIYWAQQCLTNYSSRQYKRNIDLPCQAHLGEGDWWHRCHTEEGLVDKLRWSTLGYHHNWDTKEYSEEGRGHFPVPLSLLATHLVACLGWSHYQAEAAIVNYYPVSATLAGHTDHSERNLSQPLVSVSLGLSAVFLLGGPSLMEPPVAVRLASGDVVVMEKEARLAYHAVPRILQGTWTGADEDRIGRYLSKHRININIRQVN